MTTARVRPTAPAVAGAAVPVTTMRSPTVGHRRLGRGPGRSRSAHDDQHGGSHVHRSDCTVALRYTQRFAGTADLRPTPASPSKGLSVSQRLLASLLLAGLVAPTPALAQTRGRQWFTYDEAFGTTGRFAGQAGLRRSPR